MKSLCYKYLPKSCYPGFRRNCNDINGVTICWNIGPKSCNCTVLITCMKTFCSKLQYYVYRTLNGIKLSLRTLALLITPGRLAMSVCTSSSGTCDKIDWFFWNSLCIQSFPETAHARSYIFLCSIKGCFPLFCPNKRSGDFGSGDITCIVCWKSSGYHGCVCHAGVISSVAFSFCILFKTQPIRAKRVKAYPLRWVQVIWKAFLPLLNKFTFHDIYVSIY